MNFWKIQANGNDFVLIGKNKNEKTRNDVRNICHRQTGIGADGILEVEVMDDGIAYRHYNADGTEAALCVNGIRCIGLWYQKEYHRNDVEISIAGQSYPLHMGDDDWVKVMVDIPTCLAEGLYQVGVMHEIVNEFPDMPSPDRNYDKMEVVSRDTLLVTTLERGVGITLACGSGMIASYYHACRQGLVDAVVMVHSKGGVAKISMEENRISLESKVSLVFSGIYFD